MGLWISNYEGRGPTTVSSTGEIVHHAYPDPGYGWKIPTICQGRTRGVFKGMTATADQCQLWLEEELSETVIAGLQRNVKVPVTFNQAVALGSFLDNVGESQFKSSALLRKVNRGDCYGAATEFNAQPQIQNGKPRIWNGKPIVYQGRVLLATGAHVMKWTTSNGVPLPGLILRRADERAMFEADCLMWM